MYVTSVTDLCEHYVVTMSSSARLFTMLQVAPLTRSHPFLLKSPRTRETVSREVPTSCAISSWVSVTRMGISCVFFASEVFSGCLAQSNRSRAIFSGTELDRPSERISLYAHLQLWVSCCATFMPTSGKSCKNLLKSFCEMKLACVGSSVS